MSTCFLCEIQVEDITAHKFEKHQDLLANPPKIKTKSYSPPALNPASLVEGSAYSCCGEDTKVIDSRKVDDYVLRRRKCFICNNRFSTYELRLGKKAYDLSH